jgi:hypothetical protein
MNERDATELVDYLEGKLPPAWRRTLESEPEFRARLDRLRSLRDGLPLLPDGAPPSWQKIEQALAARARHRRWRYAAIPVSVAAAALLAVLVVTARMPARALPESSANVASLIAQSQALERARPARTTVRANWSATERGIAMRIADVDEAIADLDDAPVSPQQRQDLWQRRVDLLQSLVDTELGRGAVPLIL